MESIKKSVFLTSLLITIVIFGTGMLLSYGLDFLRIDEILKTMADHELSTEGYILEKDFVNYFGGSDCQAMNRRISDLKREISKVGIDLSNYGGKSWFKKKDFDYLKRKYFLLELNFYSLINELNDKCGTSYIPILFFYDIDDAPSQRQGYVLEDISLGYRDKVVVLSFDRQYKDEPLIDLLVKRFNITYAPTTIINNEVKKEGLSYTGDINATILKILKATDEAAKDAVKPYDFTFVLRATKTNISSFVDVYESLLKTDISPFAKGDILLMLGRITDNDTMKCNALHYYYNALNTSSREEKALLYETIASIGCGTNRRAFLLEAAELWDELGSSFRARLDRSLARNERFEFKYDLAPLPEFNVSIPKNASVMTIGEKYFVINSSDLVLAQTDRVTRDFLSFQLNSSPYAEHLLTTFSERLYYNKTELLPEVGWHEGARIRDMGKTVKHVVASGTVVKKFNGTWYAPDEKGVFSFQVPIDKVLYPTTRFLREDLAVIVDTHGVNMLVEQAVRRNATVVVGCCDHVGKIKAALYLSNKGKRVLCFTDKYLPLLLGSNASVLGSPPINVEDGLVVVGNQSINISLNESIVVVDATGTRFALSYYKTPKFYFKRLESLIDLNATYVIISDFGQMAEVVNKARSLNATVIAARVFNSDDYSALKEWLLEDESHKAVLFHSAAYPYGIKLLREFKSQVTFDDISPEFK